MTTLYLQQLHNTGITSDIAREGHGTSLDLNGDGYLDLVFSVAGSGNAPSANQYDYANAFLYNPTTQQFDKLNLTIDGVPNSQIVTKFILNIATADINHDGIADFIPIDENEADIDGNGVFDGNHQYAYISNSIGNYTKVDLGVGVTCAHGFAVINSTDGKFRIAEQTSFSANNNDPNTTRFTISTYDQTTGQFSSQLIKGSDAFFTDALGVGVYPDYFFTTGTDINNDGNTDIIGLTSWNGVSSIYLNDGNGNFTFSRTFDDGLVAGIKVEGVMEGDWNGDGYKDLVIEGVDRRPETNSNCNKTLKVLINDQQGSYIDQTTQWLGTNFQDVNEGIYYPYAMDFNSDGKSDLLFEVSTDNGAPPWTKQVNVLLSTGNTFEITDIASQISPYVNGYPTLGNLVIPITNDSFVYSSNWSLTFNSVIKVSTTAPVVTPVDPTPPVTPVVDPVTPITPVDPVVTPVDPYTNFTKFNGAATVVDKLTGTTGDDYLDGGAGKDIMKGGAGNDVYVVDNINDSVTEKANEGTDKVLSGVNYTLKANFENLELTGTALNGTGNKVANEITGNELDNVLKGIDGNDTLTGGAGNDKLFGGKGNDNLTGGAGNDVFVFDTKGTATIANIDEILDFTAGDTLQFKKGVFGKAGVVLADDFVSEAGAVAHDKTDHFMFDTNSGNLYYDADGIGAKVAIQVAHLVGVTELHNTDLFIA